MHRKGFFYIKASKNSIKRTLMTTGRRENELKKFEFSTQNNEFYYAKHSNEYYQKKSNHFQGLTFQHQKDLPSLPIPELNATIEGYLTSIKPYCKGDKELYEKQVKLCDEFLGNLGPILHKRLLELQKENSPVRRNWLSKFWDDQIYLDYNDPVVPYVSYFFSHKDLSDWNNDYLIKSTAIISVIVNFIEALKNESIPSEVIKNSPFCMNSFHLMFNNSRIPNLGNTSDVMDTNIFYSIFEHNYMTVVHNGNFYKLTTHDSNSIPLSTKKIWKQLYDIVNDPNLTVKNSQNNIGILSSLPRNEWKDTYSKLIKNPVSKNSLETIYKSSFVLCLDSDVETKTLQEKARNCWHGNGYNRFFDKPIQFFVTKNGSSGFLGEHSKMDGTPNLFLNHYLCKEMENINVNDFKSKIFNSIENGINTMEKPQKLEFLITPEVKESIDSAHVKFNKITKEHDLKVWHYNRYGKEFIKNYKFSPDAYIQQIMQLAIFKYLGKQVPTYEAASTRKFFKGRTETGRSVSEDSQNFVTNWNNEKLSVDEKIDLLRRSAKTHSRNLVNSSGGLGIDRHFLGLKNMVNPKIDVVPALFKDALFNYSSTWLVSTSQLSSEYFDGYGWSQVNDNGFGFAYMLNKDWLHINIVNKPGKSALSAERMYYYLTQAADELMEALVQEEKNNNELKAKL